MSALRSYRGISPSIHPTSFIDASCIIIGDVTIGSDSSVWPGAIIRGDMHSIMIGNKTSIQDGAVLHITHASDFNPEGWPLKIGHEVTVGHQACLHGCTVGNQVLIGIGAIVLDGAVIEDHVIVAAGALVPPGKRLESGFLYKGNPCKKSRPLSAQERTFFAYSANNYVKLKNEYL